MLVAGCGGGSSNGSETTTRASSPPLSKAGYQAKLESISKEVSRQIGDTSGSGKLTKSKIDQVVGASHELADRLRDVNPPPEVRTLHAQLITALDDFGDEFPALAKKLNSTKDASVGLSTFLGAHAVQELLKLGEEFKAKGYNLNLNG
jgi:hypothetical protein